MESMCLEWVLILATLLQDKSILTNMADRLTSLDGNTALPEDTGRRLMEGLERMTDWAQEHW